MGGYLVGMGAYRVLVAIAALLAARTERSLPERWGARTW